MSFEKIKQDQLDEGQKRNLESLQASNRILAETDQIATATAVNVQRQEEQMERIKKDSEQVTEQLEHSKWLLNGMQGNWFRRAWHYVSSGPSSSSSSDSAGSRSQRRGTVAVSGERVTSAAQGTAAGRRTSLQTNGAGGVQARPAHPEGDYEQAKNASLEQISGTLQSLQQKTAEITYSLTRQEKTAQDIDRNVTTAEMEIEHQQRKVAELRAR